MPINAINGVSLLAQIVKNLPVMQETQIQFFSREDPLEKKMATHSSILAQEIPWAEEPGELFGTRAELVSSSSISLTWTLQREQMSLRGSW